MHTAPVLHRTDVEWSAEKTYKDFRTNANIDSGVNVGQGYELCACFLWLASTSCGRHITQALQLEDHF